MLPRAVYIVSHSRTPIGSFLGGLSSLTASQIGSHAIKHAISQARLDSSEIQYGVVGQVLSGGCGQAPARQAMLGAGVPLSVDVFGVNKVCSSGMKAISLAAAAIAIGEIDCAVAAGMESMSNAPHALRKARQGGYKFGPVTMDDLVMSDGLWDPYNNIHMGSCGEKTAREFSISREAQDQYAIESYRRANEAWSAGRLDSEIAPILSVEKDEEVVKLNVSKMASLRPAFEPSGGTITAANASKLNDGGSAIVLASESFLKANPSVRAIARILSFADFAIDPIDFSVAPRGAIELALRRARIESPRSIDFWEINEAFSSVPIVNSQLLKIDLSRVNVDGGAVAIGHPIGMSGNRIVGALARILQQRSGTLGCAAICNGGGGSTAIVLEAC